AAGVSSPNRTGNSTLENRKSDGEAAGIPIGLQLTTLPGQEWALFAAGERLEKALGRTLRNHFWDPGR
ncbi:MAG: hypothetical protein CVU65_12995, partial [Deltaproteobacteria bacterium HGW-Deltaproteobacteria-22]